MKIGSYPDTAPILVVKASGQLQEFQPEIIAVPAHSPFTLHYSPLSLPYETP
jgi:hypothetical protein